MKRAVDTPTGLGKILRPLLIATVAVPMFLGPANAELGGDHIIVPGERVGNLSTTADTKTLYAATGEPTRSFQSYEKMIYIFSWGQVSMLVDEDRPYEIDITDSAFHTQEGFAVGTSQLEIRAQMGKPVCQDQHDNDGMLLYDGIVFYFSGGRVSRIGIAHEWNMSNWQAGYLHC